MSFQKKKKKQCANCRSTSPKHIGPRRNSRSKVCKHFRSLASLFCYVFFFFSSFRAGVNPSISHFLFVGVTMHYFVFFFFYSPYSLFLSFLDLSLSLSTYFFLSCFLLVPTSTRLLEVRLAALFIIIIMYFLFLFAAFFPLRKYKS